MTDQRRPTAAVVIPSLNSPLIAEVACAVRKQATSVTDVEIVVAGLADATVVERAGARYVSSRQPVAAAVARNLGVAATSSDILVFLDSDCVPQPGWLETMIRASRAGRVVVSGAIQIVPDEYVRMAGNVASFHEFTAALQPAERPYLASFSLGLSRSAFQEVGGFDERCPRSGGEDLDLTIRLGKAGYRMLFEPAARVVHRPPRSSLASVWSHGIQAGTNSIAVRRRYPEVFRTPGVLAFWPVLLLSCPVLVSAVAVRALLKNPDVRRNPSALPVLALSRIAWVVGAARALRRHDLWLP